jgi:hypothetical protein
MACLVVEFAAGLEALLLLVSITLLLAMACLVIEFAAALQALVLLISIASLAFTVALVVVVLSAGGETLLPFVLVAILFDTLARF